MNERWLTMKTFEHYAKEHGITEGHRPSVIALEGELAVFRCGRCGEEVDRCLRSLIGR